MKHRTLIQQLFTEHANALQVFFRRRILERGAAPDLTQEVYLRLLRVGEAHAIKNPEAYLFTVANNLLKEHVVMQRRQPQVELSDPTVADVLTAEALATDFNPGQAIDDETQAQNLRAILPELSDRSQLVLTWAFKDELSHQEIASRLGVSKTMVHKILTRAISHCRKRMAQLEIL